MDSNKNRRPFQASAGGLNNSIPNLSAPVLEILRTQSPHIRESKTVLDSRFHTVESGFQVLYCAFFVSGTSNLVPRAPIFFKGKSPGNEVVKPESLVGFWIP